MGGVPGAGRRLIRAASGLLFLLIVSSAYLHAVLHMPWVRAVYDSVFLATTVGVNHLEPHGPSGQLLVAALVLAEVSVGLYAFSTLTGFFVEQDIQNAWGRRRMERRVNSMRDHIIVCGGGRVGRQAAREVADAGGDAVIVEVGEEMEKELRALGFTVLRGDASDAASLEAAGIRHARGLVASADRDADNLYIVLAARDLNPDLVIVARAEEPRSEKRLLQAGADRVVFPTQIGGRRLARLVLQPSSADLVDSGWLWRHGFDLVEVTIKGGSPLIGRTVANLRDDVEVLVIALGVKGEIQVPPPVQEPFTAGMRLVVAGDRGEITRLRELFRLSQEEADA